MEIVGNGFLAHHLRPYADRHADTVVVAAGVSWAAGTSAADFAREAALLDEVADKARRSGRRLLFFSTSSAGMYGAVEGPATEDLDVTPCNPYGEHKLALERQLVASGADYLVLRLSHLVGPGQPPHQLLPTFVRQVREGTVQVYRGAVRDLIAVEDVATVVDRLLAQGLADTVVNVAAGWGVPVEDIVAHVERCLGRRAAKQYHDAGGRSHVISVEKLLALVPEAAAMGFGPDYYRKVVAAYVASAEPARDR